MIIDFHTHAFPEKIAGAAISKLSYAAGGLQPQTDGTLESLKAQMEVILSALPEPLLANLKRGYDAFTAQDDIADDINDDLFSECDDVFYDNEGVLIEALEGYADSLSL